MSSINFQIDDENADCTVEDSLGKNLTTMEQMDNDSVPKSTGVSNVTSALDPIPKSLDAIPGSCEAIAGTTSFASNDTRGKYLQENMHLGAPYSGLEDDNSNDIHVTDSKASAGCKNLEDNVFPSESTIVNTTADDMKDVKVCDICGNVGYEEMLVICSDCNEGAEHIYCMQTLLYGVPEGDWFCDSCKLKYKERDQRKTVIDSPRLFSFSQGTEKQVGNENSALKISSSSKLKLSSDKMQMQKSAHKSVVLCKQQRGDSNEARANKKQMIECDNVRVNTSQLLFHRNSSCKSQATIRADSCGGLPQIKIPVVPYTRDGSLKISEAGKFDSCAMASLANKNSIPRSFSRENSFKAAETAKVKFLPTHTVASLCSGMALRESSKFTDVDGLSDAASSQTSATDSRQVSSRGSSIPMTGSASPLSNKPGLRSSFRPSSAYSCLQSARLSKSEDAFPSFLLSSRLNTHRGHSNLGSSKEAINGNGQLGLTGNSSGTLGNTRSNSSRSCVPVSSNYSKDYKIIAPGTDEVNGILKHSSGTFAFSSTMVEKSVADISSQPGLDSRSSKPDALTLTKGNSHLRPLSAEKCSAVLTEVLQPPKMICEELKGYAMAKESREGLILTKRAVEGLVFIEHPNVLDSDKEDLGGMKPMKGIINTSKLTHKKIGIQLAASVMVEDDRVLMPSVVSRGTKLLEEDKAVSDVRKDRLPMVESSLSIKEPEMLTLSKEDCKCPDPPAPEDKVTVTVTVREDTKLSLSNKKVAPGSLDKQTDEKGTLQTSTNLSLHKDRVNDLSSTLHDNTSAFRFKSTPVSLMNDSNPVEASQASAALLQTKQNIFAEMVLGRNDGKMEIKSTSNVIVRGSSDSSTCISTEANAKPTNGNYNDPFILGGILDKDFLPTSIPHKFGREVLMATQSYKSTIQPSEINVSSSELVQTPVHSPSKNYAMGVPLQGMFGFSWQKLSSWPESLFLWRGSFKIIDKITGHHIFDGMQAHPSNKASPKVYEVSRKFPSQLLLEQVQRCDAWPKRFQESPPTDEDIALYILPVEIESCKIQYFELLEATIKQDLTLRVYLECAELLIFSSNQLPESYHRYNGQMYLWGVFRGGKKTHLDDPQRQFPGYDNDGSNVVQPTPSSLLMKNNNSLPRQLTSFNTSGCSEGEEDMDVDMEGGREIGMAETPAPRPQSQPANVIESITMKTSVLSNSKPMLSHHENFKSGSCMPFKQAGISSVASWSDSVKIFRKITKRKEGIDVDIEGVREIEMAERPKSRSESQLENLTENSATRTPVLSNSKPILSRHDNSKSGRCIPFEQGLSSIAPSSGSAKILGKIPQYILSNSNAKDAERRNGQPSTYDANNELDFPPGFELPPVFHHSSAISRNNSGKHMEAMLENMNRFGVKLQGRELPPRLGFPNDKMESSDKNMAFGFSSQGCNCPPGTVLESEEFPPGFNPASLKSPVSSPDCPPGLELASMKSLVSPPDCPPGLESTFMKTLTTHPVCPPAYMKPLVSSAECPPLIEVASVKCLVNSLDASRCLELTSIKPLVSSPDWPPGLEPACIKPLLSSPECPPGLEITSMMPLISSAECSAALEVASVTCPDCPPSLEPSVGNSRFSLPFSHDTDPANGMLNPFSSECPPGFESALGNCPLTSLDHPPRFESASGKSLFPSSGPLENMTCKPLQDKPDLEVQIKMEPVCQRSPHLSSGKDYSSRNHATIYHTNGSRRVMHSHSFTSITREADKGRNAAKMSKNKSFKEEFYYNRNRREKEDTREGGRNCREKECNRKGIGSSNREKEGRREWFRNYSSEKEGRRERYRNSSREKEGKKEGGRKHSGEKQDTRNREGKNTERENRRDRDRGYHRHRSRYIGMRRLKDHEKHAHNLSRCSHPVSATPSYSALGGKCRIDAIGKMVSIHHASSSFSESNIENHSYDRPSLEKDSENGEKAVTVNLHKGEAIMDNDFVLRSEHCSLESEEKFCTEAGRILTDNNHILLCDLNDEATYDCEIIDQKNLSGTASQEHTQLNISDTMISRKEYDFLLSEQVEQDVIPVESNWSSGSMMTTHDSVKCLQLFPIWGNCGGSESFVSDRNFSLELGIGQRTASKEPLPLLEQSSLQSLSCNFLLDNGCGISRSRSVCDDSGEVSPTEASILSLSMPRYRREGNSWVEITKDTELSEEVDADLKLTLSMA